MRKVWRFALPTLLIVAAGLAAYQYWFVPRFVQSRADVPQTYSDYLEGHGQIVVATQPNNAPFCFTTSGGIPEGFDQQLIEGLELSLNADILLVMMASDEAASALSQGEVDGIMGQEPLPESKLCCAFTQPYLSNAQAIFVRQDRFDIHGLSDLARHTVAVVGGTTAAHLVQSNAAIHPIPVVSLEEAINRLIAGEVEAFVGDELAGRSLIQSNGLESKIKLVGEPLRRKGRSISVRKDDQELLALLNYGLNALEESGLKDQAFRKWLGTLTPASEPTPSRWMVVSAASLLLAIGLGAVSYRWLRTMRRKMDERTHKLRESEQRQRVLIENANDAIFSVHSADTAILEVNRKAEELTGYRRESLLHMRLSDLFPEDTREHSVGKLQEVLLNGSGIFDDMIFIRRNGSRMDVDVSASVIEFDRRKVIQILARDITERKAMERELLQRNRNLSALNSVSATLGRSLELDEILDAALDKVLHVVGADMGAIYLFDEETGNLVLRVYRGEPPVLAVQSQALAEQNGAAVITATNGNVAPLVDAWWPQTAQPHLGSFVSTQLRAKDKLLGVMNVASHKQRFFTQEDVDLLTAVSNQISVAIENAMLFTELRTAIGDLFVVKQFNENVLQSMTNGLITVDLSGRITSANLSATRIIGYPKEQMLNKPVHQFLVSSNGMDRILAETLQHGTPCLNRETSIRPRNGQEIPIGLNTSPLRDNQGVVTGLLLVFNDLSEIKKMEEEKRKLDRFAAVGEMATVLSHEIRQPISVISASAQRIARKITDPAQQTHVQTILGETERLNRLIENVLMISRPPKLDLATGQLTELLDSLIARWQAKAAEKHVRISKQYTGDIPPVLVDALRLDQALSNLVSNALDAMPSGGDLRIMARKVRLLPSPSTAIQVAGKAAQDLPVEPQECVRIEVGDTGVGIPEDKITQIFEPLMTTKGKGTGLGLAIARRIVNEHQGNISVRSKEGVGTVFTIDLPVAA
jgi:PAS domain S-box-containing protein